MDVTAEVERHFDDSSRSTDDEPIAVVVSGGIAAGKTTLRKQKYASGYVLIDAVDIFLSLSRGEYFDFPEAFQQPMDLIGRLVAKRAVSERRNIVTEIVGAEREPVVQLIDALRGVGYRVQGEVATCDVEEELRRNASRGDDDISAFYAEPFQRAWLIDACRDLAAADLTAAESAPQAASGTEGGPRKILYIDMDNVLVDFMSGVDRLSAEVRREFEGRLDDAPGIFALMDPMPGAAEAYRTLAQLFDTYILSTSPWENPSAWSDKLCWVKAYLGEPARKRLILTHHKNLNVGDFIIDDRTKHGVDKFGGEHIHFGCPPYPDWSTVMAYMKTKD